MVWILGLLALVGLSEQQVKTGFSCDGRPSGYYADVQSGCQIYHMCDGLGRQFSYSCPNTTLFQQRMLICDHWYMVNCSKSEVDYNANLLIGQREKPFVEDSEKHPYHRTPRPDLHVQPKPSERDIIYRTGRAQLGPNLNLVGVDSNHDQSNGSVTDKPSYFLPSHWSTEYTKGGTTPTPRITLRNITRITDVTQKSQTKNSTERGVTNGKNVVFRSNFPATTPSFPLVVESSTPSVAEDQLPPLPPATINNILTRKNVETNSNNKNDTKSSGERVEVTNRSNAQRRLDVVTFSESIGGDVKKGSDEQEENLNSFVNKSILDLISPPSKYYEAPSFDPKYKGVRGPPKTDGNVNSGIANSGTANSGAGNSPLSQGSNSEKQLKDLRAIFSIPDYDFPLDLAARPGYEDGPSSFQVNPFFNDTRQ